MASVNKFIGLGNLGQDPTVRYTADGAAITNISIACTSSWKDKNTGERKEETEWVRVVFYNRLAEIVGEYVRKGMSIYVEGRIRTRKWQNKEGVDQYTTEIVADQMQMLGGRNEQQNLSAGHQAQSASRQSGQAADSPRQSNQAAESKQYSAPHAGSLADMADDIPF